MDTVEFTPFRPGRGRTALVSAAAGLLIGACGAMSFAQATTGSAGDAQEVARVATPGTLQSAAATHRLLRGFDCRVLRESRRDGFGRLPRSADAAAAWLAARHGGTGLTQAR